MQKYLKIATPHTAVSLIAFHIFVDNDIKYVTFDLNDTRIYAIFKCSVWLSLSFPCFIYAI